MDYRPLQRTSQLLAMHLGKGNSVFSGGKEFRLMRRFVIMQATGKREIINEAAAGGQSEVSMEEEVRGCRNEL